MKIAFINSVIGYGSTGRIVSDLYHAVSDCGNTALVFYGRKTPQEGVSSVRIGNRFSVAEHALSTRIFDLQGFRSLPATRKLIDQLEKYNPDILHLHNLHGNYINIKLLFDYIKRRNKPVVWTLHDCWAFTGHCAYYTYVDCFKWKKLCHHCVQKRIYPASMFVDRSEANYRMKRKMFFGVSNLTLVTVSEWLDSEVKQSFLKNYKVKVIPNGIDLSVFHPTPSDFRRRHHLEGKTILLGVASIWHDRKGLWLFHELADYLDSNFLIVLVGITKSQKKKLSNKIMTIQRTNQIEELAAIYTAADIFVNPSMEETFGMVSLEALACGTPVITNRYSANPELITKDCGILVEDIKTDLYLKAIHALVKYPKNKEACIKRASQYDKRQSEQTYMDLYQEVMN